MYQRVERQQCSNEISESNKIYASFTLKKITTTQPEHTPPHMGYQINVLSNSDSTFPLNKVSLKISSTRKPDYMCAMLSNRVPGPMVKHS